MQLTIEDIKKLGPCYTDGKLREVFAGRDYLTLDDIPSLTISKEDILWVLSHYLPDPRAFARRVALDVAHLWDCPPVVREWLETGNDGLLDAARAAANYAASYATSYAARAAASSTASSTASYAASYAAYNATRVAASYAAYNATRVAARYAARASASYDTLTDASAEVMDKYIGWMVEEIEK